MVGHRPRNDGRNRNKGVQTQADKDLQAVLDAP